MGPDADVTLGEIARNVAALRSDMGDRFAQINRRLDNLEYVPRGEHNLQVKELADRITDLEDAKRWIARATVVSFLFPVLVAAVVALVVLG